jgi:hypothetical protein
MATADADSSMYRWYFSRNAALSALASSHISMTMGVVP